MTKRTYEFKRKVVLEHIENNMSCNALSKKYGVAKSNIEIWVQRYEAQGDEGLFVNKVHRKYDFEFKMNAVSVYLQSESSYRAVSEQLGIANQALLCMWVNMYRTHGLGRFKTQKAWEETQGGFKKERKY